MDVSTINLFFKHQPNQQIWMNGMQPSCGIWKILGVYTEYAHTKQQFYYLDGPWEKCDSWLAFFLKKKPMN